MKKPITNYGKSVKTRLLNARHHRPSIPSIQSVLVAKLVIWFMMIDYSQAHQAKARF